MQGKVELSIFGYDDDNRELFEIEEVRKWFQKADARINHWFFFLNTGYPAYGFLLYWACLCGVEVTCNTKRMNGYEIVELLAKGNPLPKLAATSNEEMMQLFFERNWPRLNEITDKLGMTLEENKKISLGIIDAMKLGQ